MPTNLNKFQKDCIFSDATAVQWEKYFDLEYTDYISS